MINKTTENALQILLYVGLQAENRLVALSEIAAHLPGSPTYLAKIVHILSRAGILKSFRGVQGGVQLARPSHAISLLHVVEACQGPIHAPYCSSKIEAGTELCGFHRAMADIRSNLMTTLGRWTLADLVQHPHGRQEHAAQTQAIPACHMHFSQALGRLMGAPS
jgi:Rrf2 family protein